MSTTLGDANVKFGADLSGFTAGIATAKGQMTGFSDSVSSAMRDVASAQQKASEAAKQLELAQSNAALAFKKAYDMAISGKASDEQLAVAQAQAAVSAEKVSAAQLNVVSAEEKAANAARQLAESQQQEAQSGDRAAQSENELASASSHASESSSGFGFSLGGLVGKVMDFGSKIGMTIFGVQSFIQTVGGIANAFIAPNASMEQTKTAFTSLLGGSQAAQAELDKLVKFAADTPFEFPALAEADQKLIAFQFTTKQTQPLLTAIGDALSGLGKNTPAYLSQVVDVFGQMHAAGKIQTQDLMQLTSVGINGFQMLADGMHLTVPQVKDLVTKGLIPADKGIELLRQGMEKTFGGGMQKQSETFNGLMSTLSDNIGGAWRAFTGPLFDKAKEGLTELGKLVSSPDFQKFAKTLGEDVGRALDDIGQFVEHDVAPALSKLGELFHTAQQDWQDFTSHIDFKDIKSSLGVFSKAFQDDILTPLGKISDDIFKPLADSFKNVDFSQLGKLFSQDVISGLNQGSKLLGDVGKYLKEDIEPAVKSVVPKFEDLAHTFGHDVAPALADISEKGGKVVKDIFERLAPVLKDLGPDTIKFAGALAKDLSDALKIVTPEIKDATLAVLDFADKISNRVSPAINEMWAGLNDPSMQPIWAGIWAFFSDTVKTTWDTIDGIVRIGWSLLSGQILLGLDILSGNWGQAWQDLKDMLSGVWDGIRVATKDGMGKVIDAIEGQYDRTFNAMTGPFGDAYRQIRAWLEDIRRLWDQSKPTALDESTPGPKGSSGDFGGGGGSVKGFASGGSNIPAGRYKVGEGGWEFMDVPGGSNIYNHAQSMNMANTPLQGNNHPVVVENHVHIYLDGQEMTDIIMSSAMTRILGHGPVRSTI